MKQVYLSVLFLCVFVPDSLFGQTNTFPASGNVGIGTISPYAPLDVRVQGQSGLVGTFLSNQSMPAIGEHRWVLRVGRFYDYPNRAVDIGMVSASYGTNPAFFVSMQGSEKLRIENNGNIGIGTTDPFSKLEVSGNQNTNRISQTGGTYMELVQRTWGGGGAILFSAYGADSYLDGGLPTVGNTKHKFNAAVFGSNSHGPGMIYFRGNGGTMQFYLGPLSTGQGTDVVWGTPVMHLNRAGNVGIGTTSPSHKLEVNGTVRAKEVKLEATNWPDYVFSEGYQLSSLEETGAYIKTHGRLPGFRSAAEYEAEGVNMLELNVKLLEKIEELTLYILQQKQVQDAQAKKLGELEYLKSELDILKQLIKEK